MSPVVVIGGGLSGLVAAWRLQQSGLEVQLLEAGGSVGGYAQSRRVDGFQLEEGPYSFRGQSQVLHSMVEELDIELGSPEDASVRWISRRERAFRLPRSPLGLLFSSLLSIRARLRLFIEPFIRRGSDPAETVLGFFSRRLGAEAAQVLVGSMVGGIHATDPGRLGMADAFPQIAELEQSHGSLFKGLLRSRGSRSGIFAPPAGMGEIARALVARLDSVQLESPVLRLEQVPGGWRVILADRVIEASRVVLATPVHIAARLLQEARPDAARVLGSVESSSLVLVHRFGLSGGQALPQGFGILVAPDGPRSTLGILFASRQHPHRFPGPDAWCLASFHPFESDRSETDWAQQAERQTAALIDFHESASGVHVSILPDAIPVLSPGHIERMGAVRSQLLASGGPVLAGSYLRGVSLECAVQSGEDAARQLTEERAAREVA